jgi:exosortase/archaeosortase family protein
MGNSLTNKLNTIIKKYHLYAFKDVAIFMIILLVFHVLWKIFIRDLFSIQFIFDSAFWLATKVFVASVWVLDVLNVNITSFDELAIGDRIRANVIYYPENNGYVYVNRSCSGLKQFYQWFFLMLLYPGPWRHKAWFIPLGLVIIHFVNIFRIVSMTFVTMTIPQHWDFMHDYVLRPFFYVVMFFLWVWWNEKFYLKQKRQKQPVKT